MLIGILCWILGMEKPQPTIDKVETIEVETIEVEDIKN